MLIVVEYSQRFDPWRPKTTIPLSELESEAHDDASQNIGDLARIAGISSLVAEWQFAQLEGELFAMAPWEGPQRDNNTARVGDLVVVVDGGKVPLVLREKEGHGGKGTWEVIGTAYVHGFMDGLAGQWAELGNLRINEFDLV